MTKKEFDNNFTNIIIKEFNDYTYLASNRLDECKIKEHYNNMVDSYQKGGLVTEKQMGKWCCPHKATNFNYLKRMNKSL